VAAHPNSPTGWVEEGQTRGSAPTRCGTWAVFSFESRGSTRYHPLGWKTVGAYDGKHLAQTDIGASETASAGIGSKRGH
jgi:hypothetical protein